MLGFRKNRVPQKAASKQIWLGWTEDLIAQINERDRLDVRLQYMQITSGFHGQRLGHATKMAQKELDAYNQMALLFDERPTSRSSEPYEHFEAELEGIEAYLSIRCQIEIVRTNLVEVIENERAGCLTLGAMALRKPAVPSVHVVLHDDLSSSMLWSLHRSFAAAVAMHRLPEIRFFLKSKIQASSVDFDEAKFCQTYDIKSVLTWETWGQSF